MNKRNLVQIIIIVSCLFLIYFFLLSTLPLLKDINLKTQDFYPILQNNLFSPPDKINDITIIAIDDETQRRMNIRWPWERSFFVPIIDKLTEYKPKVVYINFLFSGETIGDAAQDTALASAIRNAKNVVIPSIVDFSGILQTPLDIISDSAEGVGFSNKIRDSDSVIRKGRIYYQDTNSKHSYSAEIAILSRYLGDFSLNRRLDKNSPLYINFLANQKEFKTYNVIDLVNGKIKKEDIQNKIVLLGATANIAMDIFETPLGPMPGIYLTANTLLMHLSGRYVSEINPFLFLFIAYLLMLIYGIIIYRAYPLYKGFLTFFLISIILFLAGFGLFRYGILFNWFSISFSLLLTFIAIGFFKHISLLEENIEALKNAQNEIIRREQLSTIGKLTAQIVHEFSNPIGTLKGLLEMIKEKQDISEKYRELLGKAYNETVRMSTISKQLKLSYTPHIENMVLVDINKIIEDVIETNRLQLEGCNIKLICELASGLPQIYASPDKIRQVFLNIIINAMDAIGKDGTIELSTKKESIANREWIVCRFKDTGCGIPQDELPKIFDAFHTTKKGGEGSGLGLFISSEIIKAHRGEIKVESSAGKGSTFIIKLPVNP